MTLGISPDSCVPINPATDRYKWYNVLFLPLIKILEFSGAWQLFLNHTRPETSDPCWHWNLQQRRRRAFPQITTLLWILNHLEVVHHLIDPGRLSQKGAACVLCYIFLWLTTRSAFRPHLYDFASSLRLSAVSPLTTPLPVFLTWAFKTAQSSRQQNKKLPARVIM